MTTEKINTLIVGGGQAGLAMSEHLDNHAIPHLVLERGRIAERWRTARWDSLVANGPAWHDRLPSMKFTDVKDDDFASKDCVAAYFEAYAKKINVPLRCGVEVTLVVRKPDGQGFQVETTNGPIEAENIVAATGPFQRPIIPTVVPGTEGITQMHSCDYRNPDQLADGDVLVVGAGSSGTQIADELMRSGRNVYLSIGPHNRPPRSYRGKDYCWWLGVLGKWSEKTPPTGKEHVTIAVSGAYGGFTIDFRRFAERGMNLLGMTKDYVDGILTFAPDLADNIMEGDADYLSVLNEADEYIEKNGLDFPDEPGARIIGPDHDCIINPVLELNPVKSGISTIIWATGFIQEFDWLKVDAFDGQGRPDHRNGISTEAGVYFLGLPWLSKRGSSFIFGVWEDAKFLAEHIANRSALDVA